MKQSFASVKSGLQEMRAYVEECKPEYVTVDQLRYLFEEFQYLNSRISQVAEMHYSHLEGHLPKITGAGRMKKALDKLGLGEDFEVIPQVIYASNGSREKLVLEIPLKNEKV